MTITKYEHACVVLEQDGERLLIDPGGLSELPQISGVSGVFVTHVHGDHLDPTNISSIIFSNPEATLIANQQVLEQVEGVMKRRAVKGQEAFDVGGFKIHTFGHDHAVIYEKVPCANTAIMVNQSFYYPGDSFTLPNCPIDVLAVPASAPWMKTSEAMEFIKKVSPKIVIPTHNGLLSDFGRGVTYNWLKTACDEVGAEFTALDVGENLKTKP